MADETDYLPNGFRLDVATLGDIRRIIGDVSATFQRFVTAEGWPYELEDGKDTPPPSNSQSTNAMILFALAAASGRVAGDSTRSGRNVAGCRQLQ